MAWPLIVTHALIPVGVYLATRLIDLAVTHYENQGVKMFDVLAVNLTTNKVRILAENRTEKNADAIEMMAVENIGVYYEFFVQVPHGTYKEGDEWQFEEEGPS